MTPQTDCINWSMLQKKQKIPATNLKISKRKYIHIKQRKLTKIELNLFKPQVSKSGNSSISKIRLFITNIDIGIYANRNNATLNQEKSEDKNKSNKCHF